MFRKGAENMAMRHFHKKAMILSAALCLSLAVPACAEELLPNMDRSGSSTISLAMTDKATGKAVPGGQLKLYQVAVMPDDGTYEFVATEAFAGCEGLSFETGEAVLSDEVLKPFYEEMAAAKAAEEEAEETGDGSVSPDSQGDTEPSPVSSESGVESWVEPVSEAESVTESVAEPAVEEVVEPEPDPYAELTAAERRNLTAQYLKQYIHDNSVAGKDPTVAELGEVSWSKLALGIYLIVEVEPIDGYADVNPFFMIIPEPEYDAEGNLVSYEYDVDAVPKMDKIHAPVTY